MIGRPVLTGTRAELETSLSNGRQRAAAPVVLVPTMGALHAGHAVLLERAREVAGSSGAVVVTIFVNPLQFGPGEGLERYPRTLEADLAMCAERQVDVVFAPSVVQLYPGSTDGVLARPEVTLDPGPLGAVLEGAARPGHFAGVLTVVAKLFGLVAPDVAVFGEKDYQQLLLVRRMVADLAMPVRILGVETIREPDGLALSSRNRLLSQAERRTAARLSRALRAGAAAGARGPAEVRRAALEALSDAGSDVGPAPPELELDYLELTSPDLEPPPGAGDARLLAAARLGSTRLIDNIAVRLGEGR